MNTKIKPTPLKNKIAYTSNIICTDDKAYSQDKSYFSCFPKWTVQSAVEWLKKELNKNKIKKLNDGLITISDINNLIDTAFEDVVNKNV